MEFYADIFIFGVAMAATDHVQPLAAWYLELVLLASTYFVWVCDLCRYLKRVSVLKASEMSPETRRLSRE